MPGHFGGAIVRAQCLDTTDRSGRDIGCRCRLAVVE